MSLKPPTRAALAKPTARAEDRGQHGATAVEYVLLLGAVGFPLLLLVRLLLAVLVSSYRMVTYLITLPFP